MKQDFWAILGVVAPIAISLISFMWKMLSKKPEIEIWEVSPNSRFDIDLFTVRIVFRPIEKETHIRKISVEHGEVIEYEIIHAGRTKPIQSGVSSMSVNWRIPSINVDKSPISRPVFVRLPRTITEIDISIWYGFFRRERFRIPV